MTTFTANNESTIGSPTYFYVTDCCKCGVLFAMTLDLQQRRLEDGEWFYCPNGHGQHYCESEVKRLERQLEQSETRRKWAQSDAQDARERQQAAERRAAAQKGVTTRIKNRVKKGVCPCCNRHFENLQRHMASKHPDYAESD